MVDAALPPDGGLYGGDAAVSARPTTSRGRRHPGYTNTDTDYEEYARPKTSHGRRAPIEQPPPSPTAAANQSPDHMTPANQSPDHTNNEQGDKTPVPRPRTGRANRPRTSHGRRPANQQQVMMQHQQRHEQQQQQQEDPPEPVSRPRTSHGRRQPAQEVMSQQQQEVTSAEVAPPVERPRTSRRRHSTTTYTNISPGREAVVSRMSTTPTPRPYSRGMYDDSGGRPTSSLSRYSVLPAIGHKPAPPPPEHLSQAGRQMTMMTLHNNVNIMKLDDDNHDAAATPTQPANHSPAEHTAPAPRVGGYQYQWLQRQVDLPGSEPSEGEDRVLLAIKLPTGQRLQRHFRPTQTLADLLTYAEVTSRLDLTAHHIVCDAPRRVFSDLSLQIANSGLENRTVVHVQLPDD